jgi:hypothetical protein
MLKSQNSWLEAYKVIAKCLLSCIFSTVSFIFITSIQIYDVKMVPSKEFTKIKAQKWMSKYVNLWP